jgi:hypothetical protein
MPAHRRPLLLNVPDQLSMQDGSGCLGTIDGTGAGISGCLDTGSTHLGGELFGFPDAGFRAAGAIFMLPDIGVRRKEVVRFGFTSREGYVL